MKELQQPIKSAFDYKEQSIDKLKPDQMRKQKYNEGEITAAIEISGESL